MLVKVTPSCKMLSCTYEESVTKPVAVVGILVSAMVESIKL